MPLGPQDERDLAGEIELVQRRRTVCDERHTHAGRVVEREKRHAEDRAGRGTERLRAQRVGAALRERDRGAERVGGAQQRSDISRIGDSPERKRCLTRSSRQRRGPEHSDDAGRMRRSVETAASSSGSTVPPATRSSIGSIPAAAAASTRSSPSTAKCPILALRFCARSFRTSFSVGFDADVIRG